MKTLSVRARQLVDCLELKPHPEGGYFRETHRSAVGSPHPTGRSALTSILFLLGGGQVSRFHRVAHADETWFHHEGGALELFIVKEPGGVVERKILEGAGGSGQPQLTVPAGLWQAARPLGEYCLVGCAVGPGFEFSEFSLLADTASAAQTLCLHHPDLADLV